MTSRAYMLPSSQSDWETPPELFDTLWEEFGGFDCDPCCHVTDYTARRVLTAGSTRGALVYTAQPEEGASGTDGLNLPWDGQVYMNPPYGRGISAWVQKAVGEVMKGNASLVVALLPARTDTKWWQEFVCSHVVPYGRCHCHGLVDEVRFLPGRLRFVGAPASAPFPSAIVVWAFSKQVYRKGER
jgi:hypothetical protein